MVVPTDVTSANLTGSLSITSLGGGGGLGVTALRSFTTDATGPIDGLYYRSHADTQYTHPNNFEIVLTSGEVFVSVRHPSHNLVVTTPFGTVSGLANCDAIVSYNNGVLHVFNLNVGSGAIQVKLDKGHLAGPADPILELAPGFELVAADHKLVRSDIRPSDGVGRKNTHLLENGYVATSIYSAESLLNSSEMIAGMAQQAAGTKEQRIVSDLSKMAAVLNYVNGSGGYEVTSKVPSGSSGSKL